MHLKEMSHWLWTWKAWGRVKCGSTGKALEDIGQLMLVVNVRGAAILEDLILPSVKLDVASLPKDGNDPNQQSKIPLFFLIILETGS